jgi:hypothetical protein
MSNSSTGGGGGGKKGGGLTDWSEGPSAFVGFARGAGSMNGGLAGGSTGLAGGSCSTLLFDVRALGSRWWSHGAAFSGCLVREWNRQ